MAGGGFCTTIPIQFSSLPAVGSFAGQQQEHAEPGESERERSKQERQRERKRRCTGAEAFFLFSRRDALPNGGSRGESPFGVFA